MRTKLKANIRAALVGLGGYNHVLHLYTPEVNRRAIQASFMAMGNEEVLYAGVPWDGQEGFKFTVIPLEEVTRIKISSEKRRIIVDNVSADNIGGREEFLAEASLSYPVLCAYDVSRLKQEDIKALVKGHDKLILTTDEVTLLSSEALDELDLSDDSVERFVREYLDLVVLALILNTPMCGTEIIDVVHRRFNVLLSPGTIYPLLHELEENGLLKMEYMLKKKVYRPARGGEVRIGSMLKTHLKANEFLHKFLKSSSMEASR